MINQARLARLEAQLDPVFETINFENGNRIALGLADVKARAVAKVATFYWNKSVNGTTVSGTFIRTDESTRATIDQTIKLIELGLKSEPFNYKGPNGWVSMTKTELQALAGLMATFVQQCFDDRMAKEQAIDSCTTIEQVRSILNSLA